VELEWWISPSCAGEIARGGGTVIVADGYFGEMTVGAREPSTGTIGRKESDVFVRLTPSAGVSATDSLGLVLTAGPGAVSEAKSIFVSHELLPDGMRYSEGHVIASDAYHLKPCGMGFNTGHAPTLTLPIADVSAELVRWDHEYLTWDLMDTATQGTDLVHDLDELGVYAVRTRSGPLGVSDVRAVPDPFSPSDGPVSILYELTSDSARMPFVTVRIYNMVGQLVREVVSNRPQGKGTAHVEWDGRTDAGEKARNGRYVVEVQAEDSGGTESALGTVVLVK
jgi:hypothetical protein